jgi:hypothetical protein
MKRIFVVFAVAALVLASGASADWEGSATTRVFVNVDPNIALYALDDNVDMGIIQMEIFDGYIPWRVDANTQNVEFWGAASYLYKAGNFETPDVDPIMLCLDNGIRIEVPQGDPVGDEDEYLAYIGATTIDGFPGQMTESVEFESSQDGHFSQDIMMTVQWNQDDEEKTMGEYKGKVLLNGAVVLLP